MSSVHTPERLPAIGNGSVDRPKVTSYRPEVQGLRALAVLMVVTYHIWFGRVSGGVDVFLLISAFLLALSFIRKVEAGKPLALLRYWLHLFKRLLPAVVVVLIATLAATYVLVPQSRWADIQEQAWASLFYFQNWLLAVNSVDYYAADHSVASPMQHFWSLSVQGQVFILWPLLFALAAFAAKVGRWRFRTVVLVIFGALFVASLAFSIHQTYTNQAHAYFDTRTRLWEFALGTLLALTLPYVNLPRTVRVAAGWIGLAAMLSGGFVLDVEREFPGYVALWPLLAAALVILAGQTGSPLGADRLLSWGPLVRMGDISYALYLWHWPLLVIYLIWEGESAAGPLDGSLIIALSLVLAYLTTKFIERPLRESSWAEGRRRAAVVIVACILVVVTPLAGWQQALRWEADRLAAQTIADNPGARVLMGYNDRSAESGVPVIPSAATIQGEWAALPAKCDAPRFAVPDALDNHCRMNRVDVSTAEKTMLVIGDSHAEQWLGVLDPIAEEEGWKLVALLNGGCDFGAPLLSVNRECADFNSGAIEYALDMQPDVVFAVATEAHADREQDTVVPGFPEAARTLVDAGIQVVGIRDNPRYEYNMMECLEQTGASVSECSRDRLDTLSSTPPFGEIVERVPEIALVDATDLICSPSSCAPIVGNIHVYIDDNHLTKTYVASMHEGFRKLLFEAAEWKE